MTQTQENQLPRTEQVNVRLTMLEKRAVRFVADALGQSEADVLRAVLPEVMQKFDEMRAKLGITDAA